MLYICFHSFSNVNCKIKLQMKIYFCKYFKKFKKSFCTNSRLLLYILKRYETSYETSHLVQNICISVYLCNVLGNFKGYILTHAYDTTDVGLNFKNISPLTSSTITWIYKFKFEYIRNEACFANKKTYFIFLNGHLLDY